MRCANHRARRCRPAEFVRHEEAGPRLEPLCWSCAARAPGCYGWSVRALEPGDAEIVAAQEVMES